MHIEHVAIWCQDLERMRDFYQHYFAGQASTKYTNARGFSSYFLEFDTGCRLELMQWQEVTELKMSHSGNLSVWDTSALRWAVARRSMP